MRNNITISATEANRTFSNVLNKVYYQEKTFEIKRGKEIVARLIPIQKGLRNALTLKEMKDFLEQLPPLNKEDRKEFETFIIQLRTKDKIGLSKWE